MKITDLLKKDFIIEELVSTGKQEVLEELSRSFQKGNVKFNLDAMIKVLLEREKLGSTGIGDHIAIPHGKLNGLDDLIVAFGRSSRGIDFDAMDGKPVNLFFLLMAPEHSTGQHLKALAKISRMLKDHHFRKSLMETKSKDELYQIIADKDDQT
ncbi:PTS sugar transporter subunit IIA [Syntrophus aciditrophicus]|jgi:PTS system nitrogen regulatory IIA component|uniref:Nitrogen regulatory IIA protein n=1 Tax=Syntrophus aciditrophicus (strain SB) TaxID=56780 RepID=Q2LSN1_SYNAS|nr:PTS sugar transporter subunit IIA [Syntrophus aciditrophicus]ABC77094.1 nitrogen regulatory IIA protein [Syntrophus aciditrophicus SB]OPY18241.1 MAG: PTS system fructose-specific EIIABC component [Syntrophus sp. PtaB.Bin075]